MEELSAKSRSPFRVLTRMIDVICFFVYQLSDFA